MPCCDFLFFLVRGQKPDSLHVHSWLECVRGIARLPLFCLSPRDAKESHDTIGIRIGVGMGDRIW